MGIAILWVVLFHSSISFDEIPIKLFRIVGSGIKAIGYGGVDIFLLVSGLGIYQSLQKNSISNYIKNRFKRILPVWWTWLIIFLLLGFFVFGVEFQILEILGYASFTGFWLDMAHQGNWYVYAIMLIYFISPVFYSLIHDAKNRSRMTLYFICISIVVSLSFFYKFKLIAFSRIPIYLIGMYFSADLRNFIMTKKKWAACIGLFILGFSSLAVCLLCFRDHLWNYGLWWYPFILIAPTLSLMVCKFFDCFQKLSKPLCVLLKGLGKASLEILLVSDFMFAYVQEMEWLPKSNIKNIAIAVLGVILGYAFHCLIELEKAGINRMRSYLGAKIEQNSMKNYDKT